MKKLTLCFLSLLVLTSNVALAQPAPAYWCNAPWPPPSGQDRTMGKDSDGHTCIKIAKPIETPATTPASPAIAPPAKDLPSQAAISVTLAQDEQGRPILQAICPASGFNEWDYKMFQAGFKQKIVKRGEEVFIIYEK